MEFVTPPQKLNAYPVIAMKPPRHRGDMWVVMVHLHDRPQEFVVSKWLPQLGTEWHQGDYCNTFEEALDRFLERR